MKVTRVALVNGSSHHCFFPQLHRRLRFASLSSSLSDLTSLKTKKEMSGPRIAHATLKGPSVVKELLIGITLGLAAGGVWKMHHWNEQRKVRTFYDLLEKAIFNVRSGVH